MKANLSKTEPQALDGSPRRTVLLVDDDEDVRMLLRMGLEKRGVDVVEAGTVDAAISAIRDRTVDLLLTDWQLPDGDAKDLRDAVDVHRRLPAVLWTGFDREEVRRSAAQAGFPQVLVKPVSLPTLWSSIQRAWGAASGA